MKARSGGRKRYGFPVLMGEVDQAAVVRDSRTEAASSGVGWVAVVGGEVVGVVVLAGGVRWVLVWEGEVVWRARMGLEDRGEMRACLGGWKVVEGKLTILPVKSEVLDALVKIVVVCRNAGGMEDHRLKSGPDLSNPARVVRREGRGG